MSKDGTPKGNEIVGTTQAPKPKNDAVKARIRARGFK